MAAAASSLDAVRQKNLERGQAIRLELGNLRKAQVTQRNQWAVNGRKLVVEAKGVQSDNIRARQDSHRGRRGQMGRDTKEELKKLGSRRLDELETARRKKKEGHDAVRAQTADEVRRAAHRRRAARRAARLAPRASSPSRRARRAAPGWTPVGPLLRPQHAQRAAPPARPETHSARPPSPR